MKLFDRRDEIADVAVRPFLDAVGIDDRGLELGCAAPIGPKTIRRAGRGTVGKCRACAAVQDVICGTCRWRAVVEGPVERPSVSPRLCDGIELLDWSTDEIKADAT